MREDKDLFEGNVNGQTIKELLSKFSANYPLFIFSLIICVGSGIFYTRYTPPKYIAATSLFVKGSSGSGGGGGSNSDLIESALQSKAQVHLDDQIQLIKSSSLMERVVSKNQFNISYFYLGKLLKTDLYLDAPFRLVAKNVINSNGPIVLTLRDLKREGGIFSIGREKESRNFRFKWGTPFSLQHNTFTLISKDNLIVDDRKYVAEWHPVDETADELLESVTVTALDNKTSIIQLSLLSENLKRGKDILNAVVSELTQADIEDRNKLSESTVRFIDERLSIISGELKGVEGSMENYQGSKQLIDIKS